MDGKTWNHYVDYVDNAIEMWTLYLFLYLDIQEQLAKPNIKKMRNQFRRKKVLDSQPYVEKISSV